MTKRRARVQAASCNSEAPPPNPYATGPDPVLAWKAQVLRTLRGARDGAMTVGALAALAPNPEPGTSFAQHLQEHLIDRLLAKWVVEGEAVQLIEAAPAAAGDAVPDDSGDSAPAGRASHAVAPDPALAWKAAVLRALRGAEGRTATVAELEAMAPTPSAEEAYSAHLQRHLVDRGLAEWLEGGEAIALLDTEGEPVGATLSLPGAAAAQPRLSLAAAAPALSCDSDTEALTATRASYAVGPDAMLAWKAAVLRELRGADGGTLTVAALTELAPSPRDDASFVEHLQTHLVDRELACWVDAGAAIRLVDADTPAVEDVPAPVGRASFAVGPDPMLAWKAAVLRALRGEEGGALTLEELETAVPNPQPGSAYREHLDAYVVGRGLAEWVDEGAAIRSVST